MKLALVVLVVALLASSCSEARSQDTLVCRSPIDLLDEPIASYETYDGVVAFPDPSAPLQAVRDFDSLRVGTKIGLLVRADAEFTLRAANPAVEMGWGNTGEAIPSSVVHVPGCSAPSWSDAEWLVYPGGLSAPEPGCIEIVVQTAGSDATARIPLGEACQDS